ncbi:hypothetical protein V5799_032157 [Amblyomma americanum]|uniref:Glutamate receptor n=1 Tax=Amblyomma americanum TaxID=6943 RepID=A0AAQ4DRZ3_AMBAM
MRFEAILPSDGQMGIRLPNGSWTGAVGNVQRREVDMTIVPMIQSHSRMTVGEYGPPIMYVQFGILSGSGVSTSNVFGYILTFDWKVWALLLSAIPVLALLVHEWGWELFRNLLYESESKLEALLFCYSTSVGKTHGHHSPNCRAYCASMGHKRRRIESSGHVANG